MIGTIRKHSSWLWWVIAGLTIISFVVFMGSGPARRANGGLNGGGNIGTIYGHEISAEEYTAAQRNFALHLLFNYGQWPDNNPNITKNVIEQQTYLQLLMNQKAKDLGIYVPESVVVSVAGELLQSPAITRLFGNQVRSVPADQFVERVLKPHGYNEDDFRQYVRSELTLQQLQMTLGLSGGLITPQEAASLYDREYQEVSAEAVFFSASNYLAQAKTAPAEVGQFFTNNMAAYREPDRLQVNYVWFNLTNFLAQSKAEWAKTNLEETINSVFAQYGATEFASAKTPEDAKAQIRELLIRNRALADAAVPARNFVTALFAMDPVKPENFTTLAKQKGLAVQTSAPFAEDGRPDEFAVASAIVKTAFALNADTPYSDSIQGDDGFYVIALANQLPSSIPPFAQIRDRVVRDFQMQQAVAMAREAGTNFYVNISVQIAAGKSFAQAAIAAGRAPEILSPFSLSSDAVPEAGDRAEMGDLKNAAFGTRVGGISPFIPTADGGFVLSVKSFLPVDKTKRASELPEFISQMRRGRQSEVFNLWINSEANRELRNTAFFKDQQAGAAK